MSDAAAGSRRPGAARLLLANRLAAAGLALFAVLVLAALLTPWLPLPPPDATAPADRLLRPLADGHPLGTDHLGRDLLSRVLWGLRVSLAVGIAATLAAALAGSLVGLVAGYAGGRADAILMRGIDMVMAFPYVLLALAIVAALGPGLLNALMAIAVVNVPFFARTVRGVTLALARADFADAARLSGLGPAGILAFEILPNALPTVAVTMSTTLGWMILETAGLSFLGLGAQPPQADLGSMLGEGRKLLFTDPHVSVVPGLVVFLVVVAINLVGDGVRDLLDPRLRAGVLARPAPATAVARDAAALPAPVLADGAVLDVHALETEFRLGRAPVRAVGGVSLTLRAGECLGLVGESGSGKSVTALSLLRLAPSPPGRIIGGRVMHRDGDVLEADAESLRRLRGGPVAYVFQDPAATLHPLMTVGDQVAEAIRAHRGLGRRAAHEAAVELLARVRIPDPAGRAGAYPHELSGGMRQRVSIAIAIANDPEALIADEPTTALDVTIQARILALLQDLQRDRGAALLFITHDFGVVSEICDRVAVMYAGRIVETGPAADLLAAPAHPYTRRLIDCVPALGARDRPLDAIPGQPPALDALPPGCAFAPRCPRADAACRSGAVALRPTDADRAVRCVHPLAAGERP